MLLKVLSITSSIVLICISFFGVNGLFNPVIMLSETALLICFCILLVKFIISVVSIIKNKPHQNPYVLILILIFVGCTVCFQGKIHIYGLKFIVKNNIEELNKTAITILLASKENQTQWFNELDFWPEFIGPTRKAAWHESGVVYLDFEGAPGEIVGLCYNPKRIVLSGCSESIGGEWFRLDADIK